MIERSSGTPGTDMRSFRGKTLRGSYFLEELIGEGAFGAVFKSKQHFLDLPIRRVAVKLSKVPITDLEKARDIFADAFILAEVMDTMTDWEARRHLVHVYDMGIMPEEESRGFVVMEFVQGTTLRAQFASLQRVPASMLLEWARQICRALKGLHTLPEPVLHRDLKPDNILLGSDLSVRVIDFGLAAKMVQHEYVPGEAGTVTYMAPETTKGQSVPASDVYSLGLLLYEGLTGKHPFAHLLPPTGMPKGLHRDWLYDQKKPVRPEPPSFHNNTLTGELAYLNNVILRCLEFDHRKRYRNAGELLKALDPPPQVPPPDCLDEGRRLKAAGKLEEARHILEDCLTPIIPKEKHFATLRELGEVLSMLGEHCDAAERLVEAWELTKDSALLQARRERAELLGQIAKEYDCCPNPYLANKYKVLRAKELGISGR